MVPLRYQSPCDSGWQWQDAVGVQQSQVAVTINKIARDRAAGRIGIISERTFVADGHRRAFADVGASHRFGGFKGRGHGLLVGGDKPVVPGDKRHDGKRLRGGNGQVIQAAPVGGCPLGQLGMVVWAKPFAEGNEWLLLNDGCAFEAERFTAKAKPATYGLFLFRVVIIAGKMLVKISGGVPGRCLCFDGDHDFFVWRGFIAARIGR